MRETFCSALSSNRTTWICWRFAVDLLADRLYSKSPASLQHVATNGFVCNILTCRYVADKSVVSPASRQQIRLLWFRTDKSTASLYSMLATCCRQIRCVATRQQIYSKSVKCGLTYIGLRALLIRSDRTVLRLNHTVRQFYDFVKPRTYPCS